MDEAEKKRAGGELGKVVAGMGALYAQTEGSKFGSVC